jgi:predicted molibdopterin-dependent oxidoreductase YjgC
MGCGALMIEGRGAEARVVPTHGFSWLDTDCELCGGCLATCPTGALYERSTRVQEDALDKVRTTCTFCGVGCQLDLNVDPRTRRIVKVTSRREYAPNEGNLCVKGRFAFNFVHHPDRLTHPLVRGEDGELHPASWDEALAAAAAGLARARDGSGPQSTAVLASARLTVEENFLLQKLARTALKTNSVHSCEAT